MKLYVTCLKDTYEFNYETGKPNKSFTKGKRYLVMDAGFGDTYPYHVSYLTVINNKGEERNVEYLKTFKF